MPGCKGKCRPSVDSTMDNSLSITHCAGGDVWILMHKGRLQGLVDNDKGMTQGQVVSVTNRQAQELPGEHKAVGAKVRPLRL